jgi:hypothetical protein
VSIINNFVMKKSMIKEVKKMKNLIAIALSIALALSIPTQALAAFTSDRALSKIAQVTVPPVAEDQRIVIPLSVSVKNAKRISTTSGFDIDQTPNPEAISWSEVNPKTTLWKAADQYLEIQGFSLWPDWGIQIYTNNTATDANPRYTGGGYAAGLVKVDAATPSTGTSTLPICWRVVSEKLTSLQNNNLVIAENGNALSIYEKKIATDDIYVLLRVLADYTNDDKYYAPWAWMLDKQDLDRDTEGVQQYNTYASLVVSNKLHTASGEGPLNYNDILARDSKYYVYLGARFTTTAAGVQYKTNKLTVEMYHL